MRGVHEFAPSPLRRSLIHAFHSGDTMVMRFGAFLQAVSLRSSTRMTPTITACRMALRTVVADTPASAAMWPMVSVQAPFTRTSAATTAMTAASANVNRAWSWGGMAPEDAQRRRRSMLASDRGLDPTARRAGAGEAGRAFLASIRSESA
jgi:hypothetical protein